MFYISRQSQPVRKGGTESGGSLTDTNQTKMAELPKGFDPNGMLGFYIAGTYIYSWMKEIKGLNGFMLIRTN
jgi:hypothetical protein